ncbi:alpha/beta fold hydrolase [Catellatospora bangladeshensis]|uniref:alpha/beta fold hydrolase n=1 Tax=Catellatospora bangladeshensis TaxID=310355 RepID=UPI00360F970F
MSIEVAYERRGSGEPLLLIHGIGHHWRAWEPVLDRLAEAHDVIAIDLPGFGRSPVPDGGMPGDMAASVAQLAQWLAAQGLHRPHVAGNSLGGAIALELAAAGHVASATAISPPASGPAGTPGTRSPCSPRSAWAPCCPGRSCAPTCARRRPARWRSPCS